MARIWVLAQLWVMVAIGGGFLCILTNDLEINDVVRAFLIVSGLDFLFLIVSCFIVFIYSYSGDTAV
jgi:hypothetical protein